MTALDAKTFWNKKIIGWEDSRYGIGASGASGAERIAGNISSSLRFRLEAAISRLAPHLAGRDLVELGCGSGLLADRLLAKGARSYLGIDISETAIARASSRQRDPRANFRVMPVSALPSLGNALVFSLGLFDWLGDSEIAHVFAVGRQGNYLHAVSERRVSLQQLVHRAYVHFSYGRRTGFRPAYHSVGQMNGLLAEAGLPPAAVWRHPRLSFGIFLSDLPEQPAGARDRDAAITAVTASSGA